MKIHFLALILILTIIGCQGKKDLQVKTNDQQVKTASTISEKKETLSDEQRILQGEIVNGDSANYLRVQIKNTIYRMGLFKYEVSIDTPAVSFSNGILQISWKNSSSNYESDDFRSHDPKDLVIDHSLTNETAHIINVLFYKTNFLPAVRKLELRGYTTISKTNDWGDSKSTQLNLLTAVFTGQTLKKIKEKFDQNKEIRIQRVADKWALNGGNVRKYSKEL